MHSLNSSLSNFFDCKPLFWESDCHARGVDYSYHVRTNVSVRRVIIFGISVHNIQHGEVLFFFSVCVWKRLLNFMKRR